MMVSFADGHNGDKVRMLTYVLMGILVLALAGITLWGIKYDPNKNSFMSIEDTTFLRGFWCIIVVLVHVPTAYQNRIQDILGSFAYIGVTFFFMTSAYGLKWSLEHKPGYMDHFWRRRLPPILIPALIANAFGVIVRGIKGETITPLAFVNINAWVKVLLLYYVIFWIVYGVMPKLIVGYWQDAAMCIIVVSCSLLDYFTSFKITQIWIVEPLGFAYGILAAKNRASMKKWMMDKWAIKGVGLLIISVILGIFYLKFKPVAFWGDYLLKVILGIAITSFIFQVILKLKVGNRFNGVLGGISYEVYILHDAIFLLLIIFVGKYMNSGVFIMCSLCITLIAAILLKKICEKITRVVGQVWR